MSVKTTTIGTLVSRVRFYMLGASQTSTALDSDILHALDGVLNHLCITARLSAFRKEAIITLATGVQDKEMPDDFSVAITPSFRYVDDPKYALGWYEQQDYDRVGLEQHLSSTERPTMVTMRGRSEETGHYMARFVPTPDRDYRISMAYYAIPQDVSSASLSDTLDRRFPPELYRLLVAGTTVKFPNYVGDQTTLAMLQREYDEGIRDLASIANPVIGRVYSHRLYSRRMGQSYIEPTIILPSPLYGTDLTSP